MHMVQHIYSLVYGAFYGQNCCSTRALMRTAVHVEVYAKPFCEIYEMKTA